MDKSNINVLGKRRAPTEIKYDGNGNFQESEIKEEKDIGRECTTEEIAARKIMRIRRGGKLLDEETCKQAENNNMVEAAKCTIGMALPTYSGKKDFDTGSFITNTKEQSPTKKPEGDFFNNKANNGGSFFNNNNGGDKQINAFNYDGKTEISSIFNNKNVQEDEKKVESPQKARSSIFQSHGMLADNKSKGIETGLSLFDTKKNPDFPQNLFSASGNSTEKVQNGESPVKVATGNGIFGNLKAPTSSLFNTNPLPNTTGSMFSSLPNNGSIFGTLKVDSPTQKLDSSTNNNQGLFANLQATKEAGGSSLFAGLLDMNKSNKTGGTNIFAGNISSNFLKNQDKNEENNEEENGNDEEENDQNEKEEVIDKTKSTGEYKYEEMTLE